MKTINGQMKNKTNPSIEKHLRDSYISYFLHGLNAEYVVAIEGCISNGKLEKKYLNRATISRATIMKWFSLSPTAFHQPPNSASD